MTIKELKEFLKDFPDEYAIEYVRWGYVSDNGFEEDCEVVGYHEADHCMVHDGRKTVIFY